jgi:hypothetical protein
MSNMLKCPNPTCPYVFDPSQVPVGVVLSCPRCGMQFTLGAPSATAAATQTSRGAAPPAPSTGYGAAPPAAPGELEFGPAGRTAVEERPRDPKAPADAKDGKAAQPGPRTNKLQVFILAGVAATLVAATILVVLFKVIYRDSGAPNEAVTKLKDLNVGVETPPSGWTRDDDMRVKVGSPYVMSYRRENPEAYMAFGAYEPGKGRSPRPSEMSTDLEQAFPKLFDSSSVRKDDPLAAKWLGETIAAAKPYPNGFFFEAQSTDGLKWRGEAYTVAHKGLAYYWLSWCPESDFEKLKDEFAAFRAKFKVLDLRNDWKETQSNVVEYKGDKVPYTISDAEEVWKEMSLAPYKDTEPDLDKLLRINKTPKRDRKALPDEAELRVYLLDGGGDPTQAARKFAEDRETARIKQAGDYTLTFRELTLPGDPLAGDPVPGNVPANTPVVRLLSNVKESKDAGRLIVASGMTAGTKTVVVHCWCEAGRRNVFETKFVQIAASLR